MNYCLDLICQMNIRSRMQHKLNPLHIYCRTMDCKLNKKFLKSVCSLYDRLYKKLNKVVSYERSNRDVKKT